MSVISSANVLSCVRQLTKMYGKDMPIIIEMLNHEYATIFKKNGFDIVQQNCGSKVALLNVEIEE